MARHLLVVGAQRCGTTYLASLLDEHPQITLARPASPEPKYFLDERSVDRGAEEYRARFFAHATDEQVLADKSTSYLEHAAAAERAAAVLGEADILVLLRDPVPRAVSHWRFSTQHGLEDRPLAVALRESLAEARPWDPAASSVSPYAYAERGRYADYLGPWHSAFPGRVHVLFTEELAGSRPAVASLYRTLGVDAGFVPSGLDAVVNASTAPSGGLDPGLERRLRDYFADADRRLRDLLGREVPWATAA